MRTALVIVRQKTDFSKFNSTLKVVKKSSYFGKKLMIKSMPKWSVGLIVTCLV